MTSQRRLIPGGAGADHPWAATAGINLTPRLDAGARCLRACLITPGHISTNPRLAKEAHTLASAGCEVTVIACDYSAWGRAEDRAVRSTEWNVAEPVRFGPLAPPALRMRQGVRHRVARKLVALGARDERVVAAAWHPAGPDLVKAAMAIKADLYIAHYPAALPAAATAARRHGGLYAFDAEDFHLGDPPGRQEFDSQRNLTRMIEQRYLSGAAYVTAASPDIAEAYVESYGITRPSVLLNVFPRAEAPPAPTERGAAIPRPSLYWFSQTIGPDRGLECAVEAVAAARSRPHLYLRGQFALGYETMLDALAGSLGCRDRVHFLAPAPPSEMVQLATQYDVGLASEIGHTPNNKLALSNKLFTYLLAGLPAVVSDTPAQARFAADKGSCLRLFAANDAMGLAAALDELLLDPRRLAEARRAAFELGRARYNWEVESRVLLNLVERALHSAQVQPAES